MTRADRDWVLSTRLMLAKAANDRELVAAALEAIHTEDRADAILVDLAYFAGVLLTEGVDPSVRHAALLDELRRAVADATLRAEGVPDA